MAWEESVPKALGEQDEAGGKHPLLHLSRRCCSYSLVPSVPVATVDLAELGRWPSLMAVVMALAIMKECRVAPSPPEVGTGCVATG